jgi:hypothetical protein
MPDENAPTRRQADQVRTDFVAIESDMKARVEEALNQSAEAFGCLIDATDQWQDERITDSQFQVVIDQTVKALQNLSETISERLSA